MGGHGGFFTAQDADSEGVEGKCYLWTPEEVVEVLGEDRRRQVLQAVRYYEGGQF